MNGDGYMSDKNLKRFKLINDKEQELARVLIFFEDSFRRFVGVLIETSSLANTTRIFVEGDSVTIIQNLAKTHGLEFHEFIEI